MKCMKPFRNRGKWCAALAAWGFAAVATAQAQFTLSSRFDPTSMTGQLLGQDGFDVLATQEGWSVDSIQKLDSRRVLVLWSSAPRYNYLRPEIWIQDGEAAHRQWPPAGEAMDWYKAEARLRKSGDTTDLLVRRALVGENFDAPLLFERLVFRLTPKGLTRTGSRTEKILTESQRLNMMAARIAEGKPLKARREAKRLKSPEYRTRATILLAETSDAEHFETLRQELARRAARPDRAGQLAAEALLRFKLEEVQSDPK